VEHAEAADAVRQFTARGLPEATGLEGTSEAMIGSLDPDPVAMAERRKRHEVVGVRLDGALETAEFRWGDVRECPACDSSDVDRQTADEGRPFSCNNCGLEFFKDTPHA
jgi:ribosomal protein L37AE/L43A